MLFNHVFMKGGRKSSGFHKGRNQQDSRPHDAKTNAQIAASSSTPLMALSPPPSPQVKVVSRRKKNSKRNVLPVASDEEIEEFLLSPIVERDDFTKSELLSAENLDGVCIDMCSPAERELHIRVDELSVFETKCPSIPLSDSDLIIKRFQRSSADHKLDIPGEIRPPGVLRQTQFYLETNINGS
jgi:SAC3/GANP family